jgi:hypothetical protein
MFVNLPKNKLYDSVYLKFSAQLSKTAQAVSKFCVDYNLKI